MKARRRRWWQRRRLQQARGKASLRFWVMGGVFLFILLFLLPGLAFAGAAGVYYAFSRDLPAPEGIQTRDLPRTAQFLDRKGRLLYELFDPEAGRRTTVRLSDISPYLVKATIATEDAEFYSNSGINLRGVVRAAWRNFISGEVIQGGSSITQQLVKNVLIPEEERSQLSVARKIKEMILAFELTRRYSKDQILEWYLNEINYGNLSYGVEAAAQSYFGKSAKELTVAESALLVGLPQAPARYSPFTNLEASRAQQRTVLERMVRQGYITREEAEAATSERLEFVPQRFPIRAPHFVMYVRERLEEKYGTRALYTKGLRVTTTLDLDLQQEAEAIARAQVERLKRQNAGNAALVAMEPSRGEVLAMLGSVDYFDQEIDGQVNMAVAPRQPGSAFKPFTYVTAFMKGFSPGTMLLDVRAAFPDGINPPFVPENVDKRFRGPVSVRQSLATSLNIPAVRTIAFAGVQNVIETAQRMGITTLTRKDTYGLALTLGGGEVTLLDMVYGYSVFANEGKMAGVAVPQERQQPGFRRLEPVVILKVEDYQGRVLEEYTQPVEDQVITPQLAYLITHILSDNETRASFFGPNSPLQLGGRSAAAKTGTTTDWRDNWTVGYTPQLAVGVWVGNADNQPMVQSYGSTAAAPIWHDFIETALAQAAVEPFPRPEGIAEATICVPSGLLPTPHCPKTRTEIFIKGTVPTEKDSLYRPFKIDRTTGKLATNLTPPELIEEKVFMVLPPEAADWARQNDIPQPPKEYSTASVAPIAITSPLAGDVIRGQITITGSARSDDFAQFGLEYGEGLSPKEWVSLGPLRDQPVASGPLGSFNTSTLNGLYTLRLTVIDRQQGLKRATVPVTIDNTPPSVRISYPYPNSSIAVGRFQEAVGIQAEVQDNVGASRVEFFVNDQSIGYSTVYPYNSPWQPPFGTHTLYAVAYDRGGNSTRSEPVIVRVYAAGG